ncbi:MAG: YjjG family noncanonical pyrimidine nucleotidase [Eubacterium sp.]|nr:YjjG family noncanonical pyrimidine nucleotidase [Eubacterium sp.]
MITTVLIDVDNTLLDFNECAKATIKTAFKNRKLNYSENVFPVFKEVNDILWCKIETGEIDKQTLYQLRWKTVFERLGISANGPEFEQYFRMLFSESKQPVEGAYDILEYLSDRYTLCVASNASYQQQLKRLNHADMMKYFKHIFNSEQLGAPKPEKAFFDACFERLGNVPKDEVIMIGDSLSADISGGVSYGIKTIWFNYDKIPVSADIKADYIVHSLAEIKNYL